MNIKEEKIKIILQYLRQQKYTQTFNTLQQQSQIQLDPTNLQQIQQYTINNDIILLEQLLSLFVDNQTKNQCMLILLEQQYIKLIKLHQLEQATYILRNFICKYCQDEQNKHIYSTMLFSQELQLKQEDQIINEILSLCYQQIGVIEPNRLYTLIQQSQTNQILNCKYHSNNIYNNNNENQQNNIIQQNHKCEQEFKYIKQQQSVQLCKFSQSSQFQALVIDNYDIIINQLNNNKYDLLTKFPKIHSKTITQIQFSPCEKYFGSSSYDSVIIYHLPTKKSNILQKQNTSSVIYFDFFLNDLTKKKFKMEYNIYTISYDGWLYLWEDYEKKSGLKIEEKLQKIHCNQQNQQMLIVSQNKLSIYELYTRNQIKEKSIKESIQNSVIDSEFKFIVLQINENFSQFLLYSIDTLQIIKSFYNTSKPQKYLTFDIGWYGNNLITAGTEDGELIIWHLQKSNQPIQIYQIFDTEISQVKFNKQNNQLYIFSPIKMIKRRKSVDELRERTSLRQQNSRDREIGGVQQILNLLQRIARSNPMMGGQRMQNEDQLSSDEDL